MTKQEWLIIADYSEETSLTLDEFCEACGLSASMLEELIAQGVLYPEGPDPARWLFDIDALYRVQRVLRLQRDLEVNLAGAALVLELLHDREELRKRLDILEKHILPS